MKELILETFISGSGAALPARELPKRYIKAL